MYELRNKSGEMKAKLSTSMVQGLVARTTGYWRDYRTKEFVTRAYEFTGDFIHEMALPQGHQMQMWYCEGDILVDYGNRRVLSN